MALQVNIAIRRIGIAMRWAVEKRLARGRAPSEDLREPIEPLYFLNLRGAKRPASGRFKEYDDVGQSLRQDRKQKAKTQGDGRVRRSGRSASARSH